MITSTPARRSLRLGDGLDLREDLYASGMCGCDVGCRIGKGVINRRDLLVERHLDQVVGSGKRGDKSNPKWACRPHASGPNLGTEPVRSAGTRSADHTKPTCCRDSGRQNGDGGAAYRRIEDRVGNGQQIAELRMNHG
jgi:hypothetical protein